MTHHPFDLDELDRGGADLAAVARELESVAAAEPGVPRPDLVARVQARIDDEPAPAGPFGLGRLFGGRSALNAFAVAAVVVIAVAGAVAFGQLVGLVRELDVGSTPSPSIIVPTESPSPSPTPTPTPTPPPSPSPSPSSSPDETDEPDETPEPSESEDDDDDSSGRGGGGDDDNSGPGGGGDDDDNSGPGGGG